jgi:hypothetical protein
MEQIMKVLNSPFGLLVAGAIISGLFVEYVTSKWHERSWLFQQRFTSERAKFEKELEQKYKVLEEINAAVAAILTHSQLAVAGKKKNVPQEQQKELIRNYNEAGTKWEIDFRIYLIRLKTFYSNREPTALWEEIKKQRDDLDISIYKVTSENQPPKHSLELIEQISNVTANLSQHMFAEINQMKGSGSGCHSAKYLTGELRPADRERPIPNKSLKRTRKQQHAAQLGPLGHHRRND